jgi:hypothetical protein
VSQLTVSGFTLVRNAVKLDYPFLESVRSALPLCEEFIINCGDSDDETRELCAVLEREHPSKIKVMTSVWERDKQSGGFQLKTQTDAALAAAQGHWCLYLQADEALHEADYGKIFDAMAKAEERPEVDGVLFDYLHFYGSYAYTIRGRNWYRREVRLFKNQRGIHAYRDAQGFRKGPAEEKLLVEKSAARVFHYGYVRTPRSLQTKSTEMAQWWGESPTIDPEALQLRRHVGLRQFSESHPLTMTERIRTQVIDFDPKKCRRKWDQNEIKNAITLVWESIVPYRIGEYRNYRLR